MGVWIEIIIFLLLAYMYSVTPFMGVWIEIDFLMQKNMAAASHTLYGCVD